MSEPSAKSESQYRSHEDFTLRSYSAAGMNDATDAANKSYLGIRKNRQPLSLNLEAKMAAGIESDSAANAEGEPREVDIRTTGNMGGTHAGQHERLGPRRPVFHTRLVAEVSMKLIKDYTLTVRLGRDVLRVNVGILPGPAYFDQIFFPEAQTERNSITWARVHYNSRVHTRDVGLNGKADAGAVTLERSEIKTQRFSLRLLLGAETRQKGYQVQCRHENKNRDCFLSQLSASPI